MVRIVCGQFVQTCNDEIAVRSCPLLCLQGQVAKLASGLFVCWSLLRNNNTAINPQTLTSSCGGKGFSACYQGSHCGFSTQICFFLADMGV